MAMEAKYVFKMYSDEGPFLITRRYGYCGRIDHPEVYSGLYRRTAEAFGIPSGSFRLVLRDSLGNASVKLDSFQDYFKHVCQPLAENPYSVKMDDKGRRVLVFLVETKETKQTEPLICSLSPPIAPSAATSTQATEPSTNAVPLLTKGKNERESGECSPSQTATEHGVHKPGYHAAYPAASSSSSVRDHTPQDNNKDKKESWGTVRGMLETFVKDLNVHLADTFGDEAGSFRLTTSVEKLQAEDSTSTTKTQEASTPIQPKALHPYVFCDRCLQTISGSRFKCRSCSNFDLCDACVDFRTQFHPGAHTFSEITRPGATPLASVRGAVEVEHQARAQPTPISAANIVPPPQATPARPVVHSATCDVCRSTITGVRMKCVECPDYDSCQGCYPSLKNVHPNHGFVAINHPRDLKWRAQNSTTPVHHHVRCDGCNRSPIRGYRYKCTHADCPDFDLCQDCESDPVPRHPLDHHLLKIRQPVTTAFGGPMNFGETFRRAQEMAQRFAGFGAMRQAHELTTASSRPSDPFSGLLSSLGAAVQSHVVSSSTKTATQASPVEPATERAESETPLIDLETQSTKQSEAEQPHIQVRGEESESDSEGEVVEEKVSSAGIQNEPTLGCSYVADITLFDGSVVPAGSEFCKVWKVRNSGTVAWKSVKLVNVGGLQTVQHGGEKGLDVPDLEPGQEAEVQCECKAPEEDGRFMSFFRLEDQMGNKFGDRFWLDITVESEGTLRNSSTLSSSSIITPSLNAGGQAPSAPASSSAPASAAPSTTFSLSEGVEGSDFESVARASQGFSQDDYDDEDEDEAGASLSESEESSELEEDSEDDEFVVLSDEGDGWTQH